MEALPLHPKLVHLPIALAILMPLLTSGLLLAWWRGWLRRRTWSIAVAMQAMLVVSGALAMRSGEADEERVERVVPEAALETHEEAAESFVWGSGVVLALTLLPFLIKNRRAARGAAVGAVAGTVVVLLLGYRVGEAGGELVYRHGAAAAFANGSAAAPPAIAHDSRRRDHDDDDH